MGIISCSPDECWIPADCIGDAVLLFIVVGCLLSFGTITLFVYETYRLLFTKKNSSKLSKKFKILIVICHCTFVIASATNPFTAYYTGICSTGIVAIISWQLSYFYQIGTCVIVIIFIERLSDAVKDTLWELNNTIRILIFIMMIIQVCSLVFLALTWQFWYAGGWKKYLWLTIFYTERGLYFVATVILLIVFISKFQSLSKVMGTQNKQKQLAQIVGKQMILVVVTQFSSITQTLTWLLNDHAIKYGYYIALTVWSIDIVINSICLHAYFKHGLELYQFFRCEKCVQKLIQVKLGDGELQLVTQMQQTTQPQKPIVTD